MRCGNRQFDRHVTGHAGSLQLIYCGSYVLLPTCLIFKVAMVNEFDGGIVPGGFRLTGSRRGAQVIVRGIIFTSAGITWRNVRRRQRDNRECDMSDAFRICAKRTLHSCLCVGVLPPPSLFIDEIAEKNAQRIQRALKKKWSMIGWHLLGQRSLFRIQTGRGRGFNLAAFRRGESVRRNFWLIEGDRLNWVEVPPCHRRLPARLYRASAPVEDVAKGAPGRLPCGLDAMSRSRIPRVMRGAAAGWETEVAARLIERLGPGCAPPPVIWSGMLCAAETRQVACDLRPPNYGICTAATSGVIGQHESRCASVHRAICAAPSRLLWWVGEKWCKASKSASRLPRGANEQISDAVSRRWASAWGRRARNASRCGRKWRLSEIRACGALRGRRSARGERDIYPGYEENGWLGCLCLFSFYGVWA